MVTDETRTSFVQFTHLTVHFSFASLEVRGLTMILKNSYYLISLSNYYQLWIAEFCCHCLFSLKSISVSKFMVNSNTFIIIILIAIKHKRNTIVFQAKIDIIISIPIISWSGIPNFFSNITKWKFDWA